MRDVWKLLLLCGLMAPPACTSPPEVREPLDVGSRRQLLLDDAWFDHSDNVELSLHQPTPAETVIQCDRPWEGKSLHYTTVVDDGGTFRMWYRVALGDPRVDSGDDTVLTCYAESRDGIVWEKPSLGRYEFEGSKDNNILGPPEDFTNISVLLDPNQEAGSGTRYKMISRVDGISGFASPDGIRWAPVATNPLLSNGPFDSHNILLWDDERERYVIYLRGVDPSVPGPFKGGRRAIRRSESSDFLHWTEPKLVFTADEQDPPDFHLYTNAAVKYSRAASAFFMFPMILYTDRSYPGTPYPGLSDVRFAYSRDGLQWERNYREPFLTPGPDERNWLDRNPIVGQGVIRTGPGELSLYYSDLYRERESRIRRCTLRADGFVSVDGPYEGWGEFTTRPLLFQGKELELNYKTSGGGSIQVEIQDAEGGKLEGFQLEDCAPMVGDRIDGVVQWKSNPDLAGLSGKPVRLRVRLRDASIYAFRFRP